MVLLITLVGTGATNRLDEAIYDFSLRLTHFKPRPDIVIVAIDNNSLKQKGAWPWSRRLDAQLISRIASGHPKALGCLLLFSGAGRPAEDQALHDALSATKAYLGTARDPSMIERPWLTMRPIQTLANAASGTGPVDSDADDDAVVRRTFLLQGPKDQRLTSQIVLQMARLVSRVPYIDTREMPAGPSERTVYRAGEMLIPFKGSPGTFTQISASAVLDGAFKPQLFFGKFVLLGPTAPSLLDNHQIPFRAHNGMPNVEIQANILDALVSNRTIVQFSNILYILMCFLGISVFLTCLIRLGPRDNLWISATMSLSVIGLSIFGIATRYFWFPPTPVIATMGVVLPYWGWRRLNAASSYFSEQLCLLQRDVVGIATEWPLGSPSVGGDVVLQQITLLEVAKQRIADLRRFVDDILANFPDPVLVVDQHGAVARVNAAAVEFAKLAGVNIAAGAKVEHVLATIKTAEFDSRPIWPPDKAYRDADGMTDHRPLTGEGPEGRSYELRFTPTKGSQDQPTGWIVHLADVTPLVEAMRQREEALQLLSHDMRSPLSAIIAILGHPDFKSAPAALRQRIEGQARRTLDLADAFVRLAQAESAEYKFEQIDLAHVVQDAADAVWGLSQSAGVKVRFEPEDVEYVIMADRRLLTRALINLLDNAIKFSPRGETVTCRLMAEDLKGVVGVACQIADRAGGMAQAQLADLFHRFATSRDDVTGAQGVGLGLALVHTVVTRHKGVIRCESAQGKGTVFTLTIPLDQTSDAEGLVAAETRQALNSPF